jgi:hypothetical protein
MLSINVPSLNPFKGIPSARYLKNNFFRPILNSKLKFIAKGCGGSLQSVIRIREYLRRQLPSVTNQ